MFVQIIKLKKQQMLHDKEHKRKLQLEKEENDKKLY